MSTARAPARDIEMPARTRLIAMISVLVTSLQVAPVVGARQPMVVGNGLVLACSRPQALALRCDYRLTAAGRPLSAAATIGSVTLPAPSFATRTGAPGSVGVLLLVDTSDPARAAVLRKINHHITRLVDGADAHLRFGLGAFDSNLTLLAPIGSEPTALKAAAAKLEAKGHTTELYRNVVEALKRLTTATHEHKVLVVFSDGLAEDRAYFHADAVAEALSNRIAIYGVGYPRSVSLSVGLQSLRRLAEETGGRFAAANASFDLPDDFFEAPFAAVQNVGALGVDLTGAADTLPGGLQTLRIVLETSSGRVDASVPVELPPRASTDPVVKVIEVEVPKVVEVERVIQVPAPAPSIPPPAAPPAAVPLWYWVIAIGLLALVLLVLLVVLLLQRRGPRSARRAPVALPARVPGLPCVKLTESGETHTIETMTYRIGRLSDNDLVLRDPSVSRHHAEIRRNRDGSFDVFDLDSMNGVLVNGERIRESALSDGDSLEVGDVQMTFSAPPADDLATEETVMARAVTPDGNAPGTARGQL